MDTVETKHQTINGIDVDNLKSLIDTVKQDPAKGMTHWRVASAWQNQTKSRAQVECFVVGGETVLRKFSLDIDEPLELGGSNTNANPQEYLIAALNACLMVGYVAQCAVRGITLDSLSIETDGEIDLRGFLGIVPAVLPGYAKLNYVVRIKGSGTKEEFAAIHEAVMATSPNFHNLSQPVALKPPSSSCDRKPGLARRPQAALPPALAMHSWGDSSKAGGLVCPLTRHGGGNGGLQTTVPRSPENVAASFTGLTPFCRRSASTPGRIPRSPTSPLGSIFDNVWVELDT